MMLSTPFSFHNVWPSVMTFYFYDLFSFQGVKFIRKFKQLLNPLQVFDLAMGGPSKGWVKAFLCI